MRGGHGGHSVLGNSGKFEFDPPTSENTGSNSDPRMNLQRPSHKSHHGLVSYKTGKLHGAS